MASKSDPDHAKRRSYLLRADAALLETASIAANAFGTSTNSIVTEALAEYLAKPDVDEIVTRRREELAALTRKLSGD